MTTNADTTTDGQTENSNTPTTPERESRASLFFRALASTRNLPGRIRERVARVRKRQYLIWIGHPPPTDATLDDLYEQLGNWRRRRVLDALADQPKREIGWLSEYIASIENEIPRSHLNSQQRKRVYVGLYQCHLDRLASEDIIEWNKSRGVIRRGSEYWPARWLQKAGGLIQEAGE